MSVCNRFATHAMILGANKVHEPSTHKVFLPPFDPGLSLGQNGFNPGTNWASTVKKMKKTSVCPKGQHRVIPRVSWTRKFKVYCLHRKYCLINSPGRHLCSFIVRFAKMTLPESQYVILLDHARDTEIYTFQKLIRQISK